VLVVADGMGGHAAGEVASRTAGEAFIASLDSAIGLKPDDALMNGVAVANRAIADAIAAADELNGMGTTLLGVMLDASGIRWVSVGDSVLLLIRGGEVTRLNADHSLGAYLDAKIAAGELSETEAGQEGPRNALLSVVAGDSIDMVEIVTAPVPLMADDLVLAASDGIQTLTMSRIGDLLRDPLPLPALGQSLLEAVAAQQLRNQDNVTIVLARMRLDT
jgi:serine/threonine protein phosphatase PrpC